MDFIKKKIRQFQEKKLDEILDKIEFHQHMKNKLERKHVGTINPETVKIREEISFNEKMIEIWQRNEEKIRKQMSDTDNR